METGTRAGAAGSGGRAPGARGRARRAAVRGGDRRARAARGVAGRVARCRHARGAEAESRRARSRHQREPGGAGRRARERACAGKPARRAGYEGGAPAGHGRARRGRGHRFRRRGRRREGTESMKRARVFVFVVATLAGALPAGAQTPSTALGASPSTALGAGEVTERFSRTSHLHPNGAFDLVNLHGNIVITAGSGRDVTIEAVKRVERPNQNAARAPPQMIDIHGLEEANRIDIPTSHPRPPNFPRSVDFTITVPADASVSVRATGGSIRATGIRVEALRTVSGDIDLVDASADRFATASAVSGNVTVRGLTASAIQLTTVSGNVRVDNSTADRLMARAVSGDVEYAGELARSGRYE